MYKNDAKQPASPDGLLQPDKIGGLSRAIGTVPPIVLSVKILWKF